MQHLTAQPALSNSSVRCNSWIRKRYHVAAAQRRQTSASRAKPHRPCQAVGSRGRPWEAVGGRVRPWEAVGGRDKHPEEVCVPPQTLCTQWQIAVKNSPGGPHTLHTQTSPKSDRAQQYQSGGTALRLRRSWVGWDLTGHRLTALILSLLLLLLLLKQQPRAMTHSLEVCRG